MTGWIKREFAADDFGPGIRTKVTASAQVEPNRVVLVSSTNTAAHASVYAHEFGECTGVCVAKSTVNPSEAFYVATSGDVDIDAIDEISAGSPVKVYSAGKVGPALRKSDVLATRGSSFGAGFTNQPANDGIEVVSSSALDVQYLDLYGTTHGTTTLVRERIHLTGTSVVSTVKTNWGRLLGALIPRGLGRNAVGTITIREASGNATITTIVPTARSSGIVLVSSANRPMFGLPGVVVGSEPSTRIVGLIGTALDNSTAVLEAVALAGTDLVSLTESLASITALLIGDIDDTTVVDIKLHPHYDISTIVGVALADAEPATKVPVNLIHRERNRELEGAEAARTYSVTVTGGVIADSYTTPVSILPPPPSGKSYLVERVKASWEYGSAPMVSGSFTDIGFAFTSSGTLVSSLVPLAVLEGTSDYTKVHTLGTSVLVNEGLELVAAGDDATDGGTDNSLTLTIVYRIVSIM